MASATEYVVKSNEAFPLSTRFSMKGKTRIADIKSTDINWVNGVNLIDPDTGFTPLMIAASQGKLPIVNVLIERHAEIDYQEAGRQRTALMFAAKAGHLEVVEELLRRGAVVALSDKYKMTSLMYAAKGGNLSCMIALINRGAGVNFSDDSGYTALHYAAQFGHKDAVDLLVMRGAAIEIRDTVDGKTAFHLAAQHGRLDCVKVLLSRGAKINRRSTNDKFTAMMLAAKEGHKAIVAYLISERGDCNLVDICGWSPLHFAASWGRRDTAHILLADGKAFINSCQNTIEGKGGVTPLIVAVKGQQLEIVRLLLNYGADIHMPEQHEGLTPACAAASLGHTAVLQILIDYNVNINHANVVTGMTPLMYACVNGHRSTIILLLNYFADINLLDKESRNAVEHAKEHNYVDLLYSCIVHITPSAKVNLIPWIELECPNMIRNSMCGGPAVFLNSILYLHKGLYYGLLNLTTDCDVYLVYSLIMLIATCKMAMYKCPADKAELLLKVEELESMVYLAIKSRAMCVDNNFYDIFVLGNTTCNTLLLNNNNNRTSLKTQDSNTENIDGPADNKKKGGDTSAKFINSNIRIFLNAFFNGPLALYIDNNLNSILILPQIESKVDLCFWCCSHDDIGGYTNKSTTTVTGDNTFGINCIFNRLRYIPAVMFIMEGLGKLALLILLVDSSSILHRSSDYTDTSSGSDVIPVRSNSMHAAMVIFTMCFVLYEIGALEEKRWSLSPSIVYSYDGLTWKRYYRMFMHFIENPYKIMDGLCFICYCVWLLMHLTSRNKIGEQLLLASIVPLSLGLLRYPAGFYKPLGIQIRTLFLIASSLFNFLIIYIFTGVGFGVVLYSYFRHNGDITFSSSYHTVLTLFGSMLTLYDTSNVFEFQSSSNAMGIVIFVLFIVWSIVILFNSMIGHIASKYAELNVEAHKLYVLEKCKYIQQFGLVYEKSSFCMLPIPLNLGPSGVAVFHIYYIWRSRLYSARTHCISYAGTVSDWILSAIFLPVTVLYMSGDCIRYHFNKIIQAEGEIGLTELGYAFLLPFYYLGCMIMRLLLPVETILTIKTRVSDGRLKMSYGYHYDHFFNDNSLSNFEDPRIFKNIEKYNFTQAEERERLKRNKGRFSIFPSSMNDKKDEIVDDDSGSYNSNAPIDNEDSVASQSLYTTMSNNHNRKGTAAYDDEDLIQQKMTPKPNVAPYSDQLGFVDRLFFKNYNKRHQPLPPSRSAAAADSNVSGGKIRVLSNSPFLRLANIGNVDEIAAGLSIQTRDPHVGLYGMTSRHTTSAGHGNDHHHSLYKVKQQLLATQPKELDKSLLNAPLNSRATTPYLAIGYDTTGTNNSANWDDAFADNRPAITYTNGGISVYQPGFNTQEEVNNFSIANEQEPIGGGVGNLHPQFLEGDVMTQQQEQEVKQLLSNPSIYFITNKFVPLFSDLERKNMFKIVLPEIFEDESFIIMKQNENSLFYLQEKFNQLERKSDTQLELIQKLIAAMPENKTSNNNVEESYGYAQSSPSPMRKRY